MLMYVINQRVRCMHVEQDRNLLGISSISSYTLSFYQCGYFLRFCRNEYNYLHLVKHTSHEQFREDYRIRGNGFNWLWSKYNVNYLCHNKTTVIQRLLKDSSCFESHQWLMFSVWSVHKPDDEHTLNHVLVM